MPSSRDQRPSLHSPSATSFPYVSSSQSLKTFPSISPSGPREDTTLATQFPQGPQYQRNPTYMALSPPNPTYMALPPPNPTYMALSPPPSPAHHGEVPWLGSPPPREADYLYLTSASLSSPAYSGPNHSIYGTLSPPMSPVSAAVVGYVPMEVEMGLDFVLYPDDDVHPAEAVVRCHGGRSTIGRWGGESGLSSRVASGRWREKVEGRRRSTRGREPYCAPDVRRMPSPELDDPPEGMFPALGP